MIDQPLPLFAQIACGLTIVLLFGSLLVGWGIAESRRRRGIIPTRERRSTGRPRNAQNVPASTAAPRKKKVVPASTATPQE